MLDSLHIKNFRCFEDLTIPSLGRVNLIVGKNNSGKSTLLEAVSVFASADDDRLDKILSSRNDTFEIDYKRIFFSKNFPDIYKYDSDELSIGEINNDDKFNLFVRNYPSGDKILGSERERHEPSAFIPTQIISENELAIKWDNAFLNSEDHIVKEALQILNQEIVNIIFILSPSNKEERIAILKIKGKAKAVPIKVMGEGVGRLLQIFLTALEARGGYLMIDEFENGLHYSIQEEVWEKLFKLAKELDIQVFATTHSEDTIKAFCKVSLADDEVDGKLISLGRSAYGENKGKIMAIVHGEPNDLQYIIDTGMETR